jgi:hypothetical protein
MPHRHYSDTRNTQLLGLSRANGVVATATHTKDAACRHFVHAAFQCSGDTVAAQQIASLFGKAYLKAAAVVGVAVSDCRINLFSYNKHILDKSEFLLNIQIGIGSEELESNIK